MDRSEVDILTCFSCGIEMLQDKEEGYFYCPECGDIEGDFEYV